MGDWGSPTWGLPNGLPIAYDRIGLLQAKIQSIVNTDNLRYVLGIDGGGTKTVCILMDRTGRIWGYGQGSAANYQTIGQEAAYTGIEMAVRQATQNSLLGELSIQGIGIGVAGAGRSEDLPVVRGFVERLQGNLDLHLTWNLQPDGVAIAHDCEIALLGGIGKRVGIVAIAGTGSIVYGKNDRGETQRAGGWGYLLGDEGSGYDIALQGLQAALRAYDGRLDATCLVRDFQAHLGLSSPDELISRVYRQGWGVKEIAMLAPIVHQAAASGDAVANQICDRAAAELALGTQVVAGRLFAPDDRFEVVAIGGMWSGAANLFDRFSACLATSLPNASVIFPRHEPAYGAGLMVLDR
jgi:N-acetylglucosamine kinase-like BadF-type ATPase